LLSSKGVYGELIMLVLSETEDLGRGNRSVKIMHIFGNLLKVISGGKPRLYI